MSTVSDGINGEGRGAAGRFTPGNRLARGNPDARRQYESRQMLLDVIDPKHVEGVYEIGIIDVADDLS